MRPCEEALWWFVLVLNVVSFSCTRAELEVKAAITGDHPSDEGVPSVSMRGGGDTLPPRSLLEKVA